MNQTQFWKNFNLGAELDIAGRFIYNGLWTFHEMETLHYEPEIFEVFYNLAVGLERLLKVVVILIEHEDTVDQTEFEKKLRGHDHQKLVERAIKKRNISFSAPQNELIQLLSIFYKQHRYGRYQLASVATDENEKAALHRFLSQYLGIEIEDKFPFVTGNSPTVKNFVGRHVGKICETLYDLVYMEARQLGIYSYEIRADTKAYKIFLQKKYDFESEDLLCRELLVFLVNSQAHSTVLDFLRQREPLEFDPELADIYIQALLHPERRIEVFEELDSLYEDVRDPTARRAEIESVGERLYSLGDD